MLNLPYAKLGAKFVSKFDIAPTFGTSLYYKILRVWAFIIVKCTSGALIGVYNNDCDK